MRPCIPDAKIVAACKSKVFLTCDHMHSFFPGKFFPKRLLTAIAGTVIHQNNADILPLLRL